MVLWFTYANALITLWFISIGCRGLFYWHISTANWEWINNDIHRFVWKMITHPLSHVNGGLTKPHFKLWSVWVYTSHSFNWLQFHTNILVMWLVKLISPSRRGPRCAVAVSWNYLHCYFARGRQLVALAIWLKLSVEMPYKRWHNRTWEYCHTNVMATMQGSYGMLNLVCGQMGKSLLCYALE